MTDHGATAEHSSAHSLNGVMTLCAIIIAACVGYLIAKAPKIEPVTAESFILRPPVVDAEALRQARAAHYPKVDVAAAQAEIDALMQAVHAANAMQFGAPDGKAIHDAQIVTVHKATDVVAKIGMDAFVVAGEPLFAGCAESFSALQRAVKSGGVTQEAAAADPGDDHAQYRKTCGNAWEPLVRSGVLQANGDWSDAVSGPLVFDIMNRFRWAAILDLHKPPWHQLSPYEFEILTRWRAAMTAVPIERRVQWVVSAGKALPSLPTHELLGSLLFEKQDYVGALGAFEEACAVRKTDIALQRKCEFLRARVGQQTR